MNTKEALIKALSKSEKSGNWEAIELEGVQLQRLRYHLRPLKVADENSHKLKMIDGKPHVLFAEYTISHGELTEIIRGVNESQVHQDIGLNLINEQTIRTLASRFNSEDPMNCVMCKKREFMGDKYITLYYFDKTPPDEMKSVSGGHLWIRGEVIKTCRKLLKEKKREIGFTCDRSVIDYVRKLVKELNEKVTDESHLMRVDEWVYIGQFKGATITRVNYKDPLFTVGE